MYQEDTFFSISHITPGRFAAVTINIPGTFGIPRVMLRILLCLNNPFLPKNDSYVSIQCPVDGLMPAFPMNSVLLPRLCTNILI
jgi:hypothetical protein